MRKTEDSSSLRVLLVTSSYPRHPADSSSVFLRYLAENLARLGIEVEVLCPAHREKAPSLEIERDVAVHRFRYFPRRWQRLAYGSGILSNLKRNPLLWLEVPFFLMGLSYALIRRVHARPPDVIHAHWLIPQGLLAALVKRLYKIPVVISVHGADVFALSHSLIKPLKRFALRRCNAWTSNTRATADAASGQNDTRPARIIPMGVDLALFRAQPRSNGPRPPNAKFLVLFVGRLIEKKGCDDLLEAVSLLPEKLRTESLLWIVGKGADAAKLRQQSAALGLTSQVRFWGNVSNRLLPEFYSAADLFVAPSVEASSGDTEGQGVVILEAFASGACVIATPVGGIAEVVEDGVTGVLVEPRSPPLLSRAIEELLNDEQRRRELAERALERVREKYPWEKIAREFAELYREISERSPAGRSVHP